jgi:tRNA dimethylallyltransferase
MDTKSKVIAIVGPTASGKSSLAVKIAKMHSGEIISADSRQVYKNLDIGTGKITEKEMECIPHHMISVWDPKHNKSVNDYLTEAKIAINEIHARGNVPIVCGGTGLYTDSLLMGAVYPEVDPNTELREKLEKLSSEELFKILKAKDPRRANTIDSNNKRRLVRALEITEKIGAVPVIMYTYPYSVLWIGISVPTEELKEKIFTRLESRIEAGMIEEAENLHKGGLSFEKMEALGLEYAFLSKLLQNKIDIQTFKIDLYKAICDYAKRQTTWFKRNKNIMWINPSTNANHYNLSDTISKFLS